MTQTKLDNKLRITFSDEACGNFMDRIQSMEGYVVKITTTDGEQRDVEIDGTGELDGLYAISFRTWTDEGPEGEPFLVSINDLHDIEVY